MEVICLGGGAASFFFAAHASELYPEDNFTILEMGKEVLSKVRISGGGRCNVTHHCFDPQELVKNYPRGRRELLGPFYHFGPEQTVDWFNRNGVDLKIEEDGRMFPVSNNSQTIIDCLVNKCEAQGVRIIKQCKVVSIKTPADNTNQFELTTGDDQKWSADKIFVAPGSSKFVWNILAGLGHEIVAPVPSLFSFQIKDPRITDLPGVAVQDAQISLVDTKLKTRGPLLITHRGMSGPAILKLSAEGAIDFEHRNYRTEVLIDFRPDLSKGAMLEWRNTARTKMISNHQVLGLPKRLCASLLAYAELDPQLNFASLSKADFEKLIEVIKFSKFEVVGQNRFKEEFVTAGGVKLKEINFTDYSSKLHPNMHLGGEVLNIDAVTGGFNFQACWTAGYIAAEGLKG